MLAVQRAGESFKHLVQSLYEGIYPLTYNIQNVRRESQSQMLPNSSSQRRSDVTANAPGEIRRLKDNLKEKEKLISELQAHLDKQSHSFSNKTREIEGLKQEKHALTRDSTELKEQVKSLKRINDHFEKQNKTLVREINIHKEDIKGLRYDNDTLRRRIRDLEQENRGLYSQTESIRKQLDLQRKQKFQGIYVLKPARARFNKKSFNMYMYQVCATKVLIPLFVYFPAYFVCDDIYCIHFLSVFPFLCPSVTICVF